MSVTIELDERDAIELEQLLLDVIYDPHVILPGLPDRDRLTDVLHRVEDAVRP